MYVPLEEQSIHRNVFWVSLFMFTTEIGYLFNAYNT